MTTAPNQLERVTQEIEPDHDGRMMAIGLAIFFGFEFLIILAIMLAAGASLRDIVMVFLFVSVVTAGIFYAVTRMLWIPWQRKYPRQPVLAGAVSKSMQSFALPRLCWFNNCLRITVDEHHLHLCPFVLTVPFGAKRLSIPWEAITDVKPSRWPGLLKAKLDGRSISGPAWCLKLAADVEEKSSRTD